MAIYSIGGVAMPSPQNFGVSLMDISKAQRNANGDMLLERITTKRKIAIGYEFLTGSQMQTILNAVSPVFFTVSYTDPLTNASRTGTFYCGDRSVDVLDFVGSTVRYKSCQFDLIEK